MPKRLIYLQTVETLIRRHVLRRVIWFCTVCHLPFYGSPDYNGLKIFYLCNCHKHINKHDNTTKISQYTDVFRRKPSITYVSLYPTYVSPSSRINFHKGLFSKEWTCPEQRRNRCSLSFRPFPNKTYHCVSAFYNSSDILKCSWHVISLLLIVLNPYNSNEPEGLTFTTLQKN